MRINETDITWDSPLDDGITWDEPKVYGGYNKAPKAPQTTNRKEKNNKWYDGIFGKLGTEAKSIGNDIGNAYKSANSVVDYATAPIVNPVLHPTAFMNGGYDGVNQETKDEYFQQTAIDAMKEVDTLDKSSKWSETLRDWTDDIPKEEADRNKQQLLGAYDTAFKKRGLGELGQDDSGKLFIITGFIFGERTHVFLHKNAII